MDDLSPKANALLSKILRDFAPPPSLKVSEWASSRRVLTRSFSAEPGNFRLDRTPWTVEPMDCLNDPEVEVIVITGGSQVSKSETALNVVGYTADIDPGNILYITPDDGLASEFSRRLDDMIEACPTLRETFATRRQKGAFYNSTTKSYAGGTLSIVGAGSPSALSARPCRIVIGDEVDRVRIIRNEGDAISLARARQATFYSRKAILASTPTVLGSSRIEAAYDETDQNVWEAKCPDCGGHHVLSWDNAQWEKGNAEGAVYVAPCCGSIWQDAKRWAAGAAGRWVSTSTDGKKGWKGYRYPGLASPWVKLATLAAEFEAAKTPSLLQPFYNLRLGLPFDADVGDGASFDTVAALVENYKLTQMPRNAVLLTAGVDVQQSWLALSVVAWGEADEGWVMGWDEVPGDPKDPRTWEALEELLLRTWRHPSGEMLGIEAVGIDSGYETQHVYEFSAKHRARGRRWYATKGMAGSGRPMWTRGGDVSASLSKIFLVGTEQAKDQISSGLMTVEGAGKIHVPTAIVEQASHWIEWATAEEVVVRELPSGPKREWRLKKGQRRNEVFDTLCLALACRYSADFGIDRRLIALMQHGSLKPKQPSMLELAKRAGALNGAQPNA